MASRLHTCWFVCWLFLTAACELIPQQLTDCSVSRPCPGSQLCDAETSRCVDTADLGAPTDVESTPDLAVPECVGTCLLCQLHSDCPSLVCDDYLRSGFDGTCVPTAEVVYVDNRNGMCAPGGSGETPAAALCTITEALLHIDGARKRVIRVMASTREYSPIAISDQSVAIFGPAGQGGKAQIQGGGVFDAIAVSGTASVIVNGLDVTRGTVVSDRVSMVNVRTSSALPADEWRCSGARVLPPYSTRRMTSSGGTPACPDCPQEHAQGSWPAPVSKSIRAGEISSSVS